MFRPPGEICVAGGTGFLGSRLVPLLAGEGWRVRVPTRRREIRQQLAVLPSVRVIPANVHHPTSLEQVVEGCRVVVNLVGVLNERGRDGSGFRRVHVELVEKLLAACQRTGVEKFVHVSALKSSAASGPSHYLRTRGLAEDVIRQSLGLDWTILRPSVIFGPGDSFVNRFARLLKWTPLVFPLACPEARFAPVHVDDVAAALLKAITDPSTNGRSYDLGGPEVLTLRECVERVAQASGLSRRIIGLPQPVARLQATLMEFLPGKPFSLDNLRSLSVDSVPDNDGLGSLGIQPRSLAGHLSSSLTGLPRPGALDMARQRAGR